MKQVNFTHPGGFPLEQETLEKLQTAYRHELFGALKSHLGINPDNDYIIAPPINAKEGWAIIHPKDNTGKRTVEGILYPIKNGTVTLFLKTTRTGTNLTYGNGESQTAYFDYEAQYISDTDYANRPVSPPITDALAVHYYDLSDPAFITIKDIQTIEGIIKTIEANITTIKSNITTIEGNINAVESNIDVVEGNINTIEANIVDIKKNYLLIKGSELNTSPEDFESSENSLLLLDNVNQVIKSNNLLNSLLSRITKLEKQPATAVPKGMIAIWGKPSPFPEGWEEYVPLRGRVPVGLDLLDTILNKVGNSGGSKDAVVVEHSHDCNGFDEPNTGINALEDGSYKWGLISKTTTVGESGTNKNLQPYRVVHFIEYTGNTIEHADTIAPTSPTNLETSKIGTKSLILTWTVSTDNVGVTNYLVYKDNSNTPLAELGKDALTYNITGLSANTSYSFQVRAKDAAGNLSDPATVSVTTLNTTPVTPTVPTLTYGFVGENLHLEWPNFIDEGPITYELYRTIHGYGPMLLQTSTNHWYDDKLSNGLTYSYQIRINSNGYISGYSNTVTVTARF
jgi:hypothetical protein